MDNFQNTIKTEMDRYLPDINCILTEKQKNQFVIFCNMLIETNKVMNLTAIIEPKEIVLKHFIDSLCIAKTEYLDGVQSVIDVGTGAGFPGLPLAIAFPSIEFTLLDSLKKRITFIEQVCEKSNIKNVKAYHGRAEDYGHDEKFREKYDCCVSRAVANLSTLAEYCIPFVRVGGRFISYKSGDVQEEVESAKNAMNKLNVEIEKIFPFQLPQSDIQRTFIEVIKKEKTKDIYPRSAGKPSKKPL